MKKFAQKFFILRATPRMIKKIHKFILDTLFPISCLNCRKEGSWLCPECLEKIKLLPFQVCPLCEKIATEKGRVCSRCRGKTSAEKGLLPIDGLLTAVKYSESNISHLVHLYKYSLIFDLSVPLGKLLVKSFIRNNLPLPDFIIPVPLHARRLRWRGFNQAELLSWHISQNITPAFSIPVLSDLLIRKKYTLPQMKIKNYGERQKNIRGAFRISLKDPAIVKDIKGKRILLIDDIATTGATLLECGNLLKKNGVKEIFGAVIARQEIEG